MAEAIRLTKEEWDSLEPLLADADTAVHEQFVQSTEVQALTGATETTPGYQLLQRLKELNDEAAVKLFRASEMYHHEITRADITVAYLAGKKACCGGAESK